MSDFLFNAKNIITLWGPHGEINDYNTREWAGLTKEYQGKRWSDYLHTIRSCIREGREIELSEYYKEIREWGYEWAKDDVMESGENDL